MDEVAVVTGVIDQAEHPDLLMEFVGQEVAFTVYDGGRHDRIGWVWGFFGAPVNPLQGTAPIFPLTTGGFTVKGGQGQRFDDHAAVALKSGTSGTSGTEVVAMLGGTGKTPADKGAALRFTLAGKIAPGDNPLQVKGGFHVTQHKPNGKVVADFTGRLTCLTVGGKVGIATGVVTSSANPDQIGKPVSFSLKDGHPDRLGWLWTFSPTDAPTNDCQSTTPSYAPDWGTLTVH